MKNIQCVSTSQYIHRSVGEPFKLTHCPATSPQVLLYKLHSILNQSVGKLLSNEHIQHYPANSHTYIHLCQLYSTQYQSDFIFEHTQLCCVKLRFHRILTGVVNILISTHCYVRLPFYQLHSILAKPANTLP